MHKVFFGDIKDHGIFYAGLFCLVIDLYGVVTGTEHILVQKRFCSHILPVVEFSVFYKDIV